MEYIHRHIVELSDTDAGGIVYHADYVLWAEHAASAMLRSVGITDLFLDAESVSIEYMRPGSAGDEAMIAIRTKLGEEGCMILDESITRGDDTLAVLSVKAKFRKRLNLEAVPVPAAFQC